MWCSPKTLGHLKQTNLIILNAKYHTFDNKDKVFEI